MRIDVVKIFSIFCPHHYNKMCVGLSAHTHYYRGLGIFQWVHQSHHDRQATMDYDLWTIWSGRNQSNQTIHPACDWCHCIGSSMQNSFHSRSQVMVDPFIVLNRRHTMSNAQRSRDQMAPQFMFKPHEFRSCRKGCILFRGKYKEAMIVLVSKENTSFSAGSKLMRFEHEWCS